jgi:hypothetical protein
MKIALNLILVIVFCFFSYHVARSLGLGDLFGFQYKGTEISLAMFYIIALSTVAGVLLGVVYEYLDLKAASEVTWWKLVFESIKTPRFGMSLLATPLIVFYVFDEVYSERGLTRVSRCSVYKVVFFWDRALKALATGLPERRKTSLKHG